MSHRDHAHAAPLRVGIVTLSDRGHAGLRADESGPALERLALAKGWTVVRRALLPDDEDGLARLLADWAEEGAFDLVLTTGGTGLGPRDRTPEATRRACDFEIPGLGERLRAAGAERLPAAVLSRATAGARGRCLIVNLPGSPRGAEEGFLALSDILPHAAAVLRGADHDAPRPRRNQEDTAHEPSPRR